MIGQVQTINGVKQVVPLSNESTTDYVTDNDMRAVTSNAVFDALKNTALDKIGTFGLLGGCNASSSGNFVDLIHEISKSNGGGGICGGSINTTTTSLGIPASWYNFLYIPHRTGRGGDNYQYGTLLVFPMVSNTNYFYYVHHISGTIYNAHTVSGDIWIS